MIEIPVKAMVDKDLEFIETLQRISVPRNVARLITYLKDVREAQSREIELATGLRQPEVSIAMRTMRKNSWINEREVKGPGKGRPTRFYTLRVPIEDIVKYFEEEARSESARTMAAIQRLKELSAA
jgi:predicted transcriptional regulator